MANPKRVLTGIQPSGLLHLGNYLGTIQQLLELQNEHDSYFMLADLHAVTVPQDPKELRRQIQTVASLYLACGLDPKKAVIFRQSDISAHAELGWLLTTITTMGEMRRMTQFKDKTGKSSEEKIGVGLFTYPALMAADILLYQAHFVPVGEDQKQHVELTRDLATRFNNRFGKTFTVPEPLIRKAGARIMGLDDPTKKMSKSAASPNNYIALTDSADTINTKVKRAVTDSGSEIRTGPDKPALTNLLTIYSLLSGETVRGLERQYEGKTYKQFKDDLAETITNHLAPIQERLTALESEPEFLEKVLARGAKKAQLPAEETLAKAKTAMGL